MFITHSRPARWRAGLTAIAAASLLALTACGEGSPSSDADDSGASGAAADGELTSIEVGVIPIVDVAPIYLGVQEGIFEEYGLDVNLTLAQGGAAIVPAVQSGDMDFGFSNITSLVISTSRGLEMELVAAGPQTTGNADDDFSAVLVPEDSDVESMADLAGKSIAVNTLNNINDTVLKEGMRQAGGDPDSMDLTEVAFPEMPGQLEAGNVDAVMAVEPFKTIVSQTGAREIYAPYAEPIEDLTVAGYFTTSQRIQEDPELVDAFVTAMKESQQFAEDNPDAVREILPEYTSLDPEIIEELTISRFPQEINTDSVQRIIELSLETGLIDNEVALEDFIYDGA